MIAHLVRPTFARIDLETLKANYRAVRTFVGQGGSPGPAVIAVVKANAYGHGVRAVALALEEAGVTMLACADIEEGVELRDAGVRVPILVFGALSTSDLSGLIEKQLTPTVSSPAAATALQTVAVQHGVQLRCHLKIDTGMNRFGFRHDNLDSTLPPVLASPNLSFDAVYTHFATAECAEDALYRMQRERFACACGELARFGLRDIELHTANSAALLGDRDSWHHAVRPGLLLYGVAPPKVTLPPELDVRPVMSLRSRVVAVKGMHVGETLGYGARFTAGRPTRVAVVPAGYADGVDVRLSGGGHVLVRGRRVRVIGSVCMDSITIDVTDIDVSPGDEVVVIGEQSEEQISATEVAEWVGTVPHEVLCRTGSRIERVYTS